MKLKLVCNKCKSENARMYGRKHTCILDDETLNIFDKEFPNLPKHKNYFIAECICDDCNNHFDAKVFVDIKVTEISYVFD